MCVEYLLNNRNAWNVFRNNCWRNVVTNIETLRCQKKRNQSLLVRRLGKLVISLLTYVFLVNNISVDTTCDFEGRKDEVPIL